MDKSIKNIRVGFTRSGRGAFQSPQKNVQTGEEEEDGGDDYCRLWRAISVTVPSPAKPTERRSAPAKSEAAGEEATVGCLPECHFIAGFI